MQQPTWADIWMVGLTFALCYLTAQQARHFRRTERAYVKISHKSPGLVVDSTVAREDTTGELWVELLAKMKVSNMGNTPATVTAAAFTLKVSRGDDEVLYDVQVAPLNVFLTKGDWVWVPVLVTVPHPLYADLVRSPLMRRSHATLFGHVDYVDRFEQTHRAGYGRRVGLMGVHQESATCFALDFEEGGSYNYDRELSIGENGYF